MTPRYTRPDHDLLLAKADTLIEALPWTGQLVDETVIIKHGDNAMIDDNLKRAFAEGIVFLRHVGLGSVVAHGGGPQINSMLEWLGTASELRGGLRVTTSEAMDVARMVLMGQIGRELVSLINTRSPLAIGMSGEDGGLLQARCHGLVEGGEEIGLGFVGDIDSVDPSALLDLIEADRVPMVATVVPGPDDQIYNVNADTAASTPALMFGAKRLVMLTDAAGLYANHSDGSTIISSITPGEVRQLMSGLTLGTIPKMEAHVRAVEGGVRPATIIDGRMPHCLLLGIFTDDRAGTMVCEEPV